MKPRTWISALATCALIGGFVYAAMAGRWDQRRSEPLAPPPIAVASASSDKSPSSVSTAMTLSTDPVFTLHVGDPYSKAVALYGEVEHQKNGYRSWSLKELTLTAVVDENSIIRHLWVVNRPGQVLCTPEGFCLGRDDVDTFVRKARGSGLRFEEQMATGEGMTVLDESRDRSISGDREEKVQYSWTIDEGEVIDGKPFEGVSEEQLSDRIFLHVPMKSYSLDSTDPKYRDRPPAPGSENEDGGD
jgi:hypothetical protein